MRFLTLNIAFNCILFIGATTFLVKSFETIDYEDLEGLDQKSLSKLAGQWAVQGVVPTEYENLAVATFAGVCFWGTELHFQRLPGVVATCVGYTQGWVEKPTYEQVCSGRTGHAEGIQLLYDPTVCSYEVLLNKLFQTKPYITESGW
jgi:peptide-methionine (S)-S-oxide reductase